ncbi:MAG: alpha-amylase family glycosyl hydrolase [Chloroflexota bacterium]
MAINTPKSVRQLVIYEIYVRNHGQNGTFSDISTDLARIREMGVDVVWFMPIHPIGQLNKKGELGCPYSIQDYRDTNPEYGSREEFRMLVQFAHALGLKVIIDVVYNHTAHDFILLDANPDWYHLDENGRPTTTVPDWSDIVDLKHPNEDLWDYLIDSLKLWVNLGVDGFRCDVASLVPLPFWQRAREELATLNPNLLWLAESVHTGFLIWQREMGKDGAADGELHSAFDLSYDYDIWPLWEKAVADPDMVPLYFSALQFQKGIYPQHTIKMRCVENHDQPRIAQRAPSRAQALAWTAFQAFNEGAFLIYAGQESENLHTPSLFDIDKVAWNEYSLQRFITKLCKLKKHATVENGRLTLLTHSPILTAVWHTENETIYGAFNVQGIIDVMPTPLPDGQFINYLSDLDERIEVRGGEMMVPETAVVVILDQELDIEPFRQPSILLF